MVSRGQKQPHQSPYRRLPNPRTNFIPAGGGCQPPSSVLQRCSAEGWCDRGFEARKGGMVNSGVTIGPQSPLTLKIVLEAVRNVDPGLRS